MLHSTFKNLPSGSHADKNFILRLINLSSAGIGLISVWRKRKNHIPLQKTVFFQGGGGDTEKKNLPTPMCWWDFDNVPQIGFKGPKDHETNQQNCSCSFYKKLWGVQLGHSASESNQPGTSTTDFNQERGRERETQRVTWTVTSLSIYVCVCKVKNNLQRFCLEFITILTDTTSGGGERGRWAALSRSGQFVISLQ